MITTDKIWQNGTLVNWDDANTHVLSHGLHYSTGAFEGVRCYKTEQGPAIFKLKEHTDRLFFSADVLGMTMPFTHQQIQDAIVETVKVNNLESGYIRPLIYYGYGSLGMRVSDDLPVDVVIACWPWGAPMSLEVDLKVSEFIRIHPKSTVSDAKLCGHYINSFLANLAIRKTHYHEALMLDMDGYVAEGCVENIFIIKDGKLTTTPPGTILNGITRQTTIQIAHDLGLEVTEKRFKVKDILTADEALLTGTAIEVAGVSSVDDQKIGGGKIGPITQQIRQAYLDIVGGKNATYHHDLTLVK